MNIKSTKHNFTRPVIGGLAVIVKKSSPKNLSADCRPTGFAWNIGYLLADCW